MVSKQVKKYTTPLIIRKGGIKHNKILLQNSHAPLSENGNGYNHFETNLALPSEVGDTHRVYPAPAVPLLDIFHNDPNTHHP